MFLSLQQKLFQHVDEHIAFYTGVWKQFYAQLSNTTLSTDPRQTLEFMIAQLHYRGMQTQIINQQNPLIYGELTTHNAHPSQTLLFYHHYDSHAPDSQDLIDIAALLSALDVCTKILGQIPVNIKWLLDGSKENVDPDLHGYLEEHSALLQADGCVWSYTAETGPGDNGTPILALGTKGLLCTELTVQTASTPLHSMHGAIAPNALWRLLWALSSLKDAREEILIEGFYDTLLPAPDETVAMLYTLPDNAHSLAQMWDIPQLLMNLQGFQLHYTHMLIPTCTVNGITGGHLRENNSPATTTTIPTLAKAQIDFHLLAAQEPQDIFTKLQQHLQTQGFGDIQTRILSLQNPLSTPADDPFIQLAVHATEQAYEQKPYLLPTTIGSYPLSALRMQSTQPIILLSKNGQTKQKNTFAAMIKQVALIIEGAAYATHTTQ